MSEAPIILTIPKPPSLNKLWITVPGRRRARSPEYSQWLRAAGWDVRRQMIGIRPIECRYDMEIHVPISRRDTGNWEKPIGDLLEACGVVTNDGNVHRLTVLPLARDDCAVCLTPLPEMDGIRKASPPKFTRTSMPRVRKPTANTIARFESIRAKIMP